jgi:CheY-like chemotaxis protein
MNTVISQEKPIFSTSQSSSTGQSVLIIEDESQYANFLKTVLEDHGFTVRVASNADQALCLANEDAPDLITLDLLMPGKTGIKLYRELRTRDDLHNTKIVILTGLDTDSHGLCSYDEFFKRIAEKGQVAKPDAYLTKPIEAELFINSINRVMNN